MRKPPNLSPRPSAPPCDPHFVVMTPNFVELIKRYADIDELTQALLNTLIDRIEVHEPEEINGEFVQKIDVFYKYVGIID